MELITFIMLEVVKPKSFTLRIHLSGLIVSLSRKNISAHVEKENKGGLIAHIIDKTSFVSLWLPQNEKVKECIHSSKSWYLNQEMDTTGGP